MSQTIVGAIDARSMIRFEYSGGERLVEPYCYGVTRKGNEVLRAYQADGWSESGNPVGWKLFSVKEMSGLRATDIHFAGDRPEYNPDDSAMERIIARV